MDNLERAVCQGLDKYHSCYNFDQLFGKFDNKTDSKNIIFIDSLDEHNKKEDWWTVSEHFFREGGELFGLAEILIGVIIS